MTYFRAVLILLAASSSALRGAAQNGDNVASYDVSSTQPPAQIHQLVAFNESNREETIKSTKFTGNWETDESIFDADEFTSLSTSGSFSTSTMTSSDNYDEPSIESWESDDESITDNTRSLAAECGPDETYFKLVLNTDNYGFEESWTLTMKQNGTWVWFAAGPTSDTIYRDNISYTEGYCLLNGTYKFTIKDKFEDGMCCEQGNGGYNGYVAGIKRFGSSSGDSNWAQRVHEFSITTSTTSISATSALQPEIAERSDRRMTTRDQLWLSGHNKRRKVWHKRHGKSYVPLQWSNSLKTQAGVYAKKLVYLCGGDLVHDKTEYGENLASNAGNGKWADLRHPEKIMIRWVEKEANVGWPANSHLTQALWRATKYVGCYEHATKWRTGMCHIQVCRYAKPGNCNMGAYANLSGDKRWLTPMLKDDSKCGPSKPP